MPKARFRYAIGYPIDYANSPCYGPSIASIIALITLLDIALYNTYIRLGHRYTNIHNTDILSPYSPRYRINTYPYR